MEMVRLEQRCCPRLISSKAHRFRSNRFEQRVASRDGVVVATRKNEHLHSYKLLVDSIVAERGDEQKGHVIAIDSVRAVYREIVLVVQVRSARVASGRKDTPVDAADVND
jgi:microcompartment protein CcmK/EutM